MKTHQHITIIGAGLVGCMLACLLARRGHKVSVFERRADPRITSMSTGRSTHLVISERGWKALDALDLREEVLPVTLPLKGRRIHTLDQEQVFQPYGKEKQSIYAIHRNALNQILVNLAIQTPNISMHFSQRCVKVESKKGNIVLENVDTGVISEEKADRIFAADGAFSEVRMQMLRSERIDYSQVYESFGYKELTISAEHAVNLEQDAMHAWPRGKVSLFAFPNPDGSFTATILAPFDGEQGFASLSSRENITQLFAAQFPDVDPSSFVNEIINNPISSLASIRCTPWVFDNKVALVGDAAHAMVPFFGQGMNTGFEDCTVLAELLDQYDEDFDQALKKFESLRKPHSEAITTMSSRNFLELTEHIGDPKFHFKKKLEREVCNLYPQRYVSPYELIAFTHIPFEEAFKKINELEEITGELVKVNGFECSWDSQTVEQEIHALIGKSGVGTL